MYRKPWVVAVPCFAMLLAVQSSAQQPDVNEIISKSVEANKRDFAASPHYNWKERDRTAAGVKEFQATMIEGTPYNRLIAENGKPLSPQREQQEIEKQKQVTEKRKSESPDARRERIANFEKGRRRNNNMIAQLTEAFNFTLLGTRKVRGFTVWALKATPKPGYKPPNMDAQVLPGMQGELWIDQATSQWVHVHAMVIHPVSIEGFLAQVEPGTAFDLQKAPVGNGIWLPTHFSEKAQAKVLFMFSHNSQEEDTFWDYQPAN